MSTLKNFSYLSLAHFGLLLIGVITSSLWARYTSVELYGKYQLMLSFVAIVTVLSMPGLSMSAQLSAAKKKHGNLDILFRKKLLFSLIGSFVMFFAAAYYFAVKNDPETTYMILIAAFIFPAYNLKTIWESWMTAVGEYKKLSMIQVWYGLMGLVSILFCIVIYNNIYLLVFVSFLITSLSNFLLIRYFKKNSENNEEDRELVSYGYRLSWALLIPVILSFDKFIISEYLNVRDVAIYSIAMIFPSYVKTLYDIINRLITPNISAAESVAESWSYLREKLLPISLLFFMVGIIGFLTINFFIHLLYTDKYAESAEYAKWLWVFTVLAIPATYLANILRAQKKLAFSYVYESFNSFGKLGLMLILIPVFKLWGIVYCVGAMSVLSSLLIIYFFSRELKYE